MYPLRQNRLYFEKYYPKRFQKEADKILEIKDKRSKRESKRLLIEKVKIWISTDDKQAKEEFKESAKEIIDVLKKIAKSLK